MATNLKCQSCGREITEEEVSVSGGQNLCEDCYIDASHKIRVCDPWAERSKMIFRESHGLTGTDGLTDLQKEIYEYIESKGKATREELAEKFKLPSSELENQFAILRHCQLIKGKKEGEKVYLVLW